MSFRIRHPPWSARLLALREKNSRAAAKQRRFPTRLLRRSFVMGEGSRMTDRLEYVKRSTAEVKEKKKKKKSTPALLPTTMSPLILRRHIKNIIPVNNYPRLEPTSRQ